MKIITSAKFAKRTYKEIGFEGVWADAFGKPEWRSRLLIYGNSGNGKTELACQLANYMIGFGKVLYFSAEQGDSKSLQMAFERNNLLHNKNITLAYEIAFKDVLNAVKKRSKPSVIIVDSLDYIAMTKAEYIQLNALAKNTMLVFVAWAKGNKPKSQSAKDIEYMVDIKVTVINYVAFGRSRYGGNTPYIINDERAKPHHAFMNRT
jgi:ATPase family associated with various cellular activities (AAA)